MEQFNTIKSFPGVLFEGIGAHNVRGENQVKFNHFLKGQENERYKNVSNFGSGFGPDGLPI